MARNLTSSASEGDNYGVWLRAEDGAFFVVREGNSLCRSENPRGDYFDFFSRDELEGKEEGKMVEHEVGNIFKHV